MQAFATLAIFHSSDYLFGEMRTSTLHWAEQKKNWSVFFQITWTNGVKQVPIFVGEKKKKEKENGLFPLPEAKTPYGGSLPFVGM